MIGQTLNSTYRLLELVGNGGSADVYLGRDLRSNTVVAVKILHDHIARDPEVIRRFMQEAQTAQMLVEPHIVRVLDANQDNGSHYIVMEYVQGHTLASLIKNQGCLSVHEAVDYVCQVLQALETAHKSGVVHRDIKPQNIMITPNGLAKVMDFGIAKNIAATALTQTGVLLGTPQYTSPEQANGVVADARSDLYSVAIMLFEALVGKPPFDDVVPLQILRMQADESPPQLSELRPDVPLALEKVVARGLEKDPKLRFQSASEMKTALSGVAAISNNQQLQQNAAIDASVHSRTTVKFVDQSKRPRLVRRIITSLIAVSAIMLLAGTFFVLTTSSYRQSPVSTATAAALSNLATSLPVTPASTVLPAAATIVPTPTQPGIGVTTGSQLRPPAPKAPHSKR